MPFWCTIRLLILIVSMKMLLQQISVTKTTLKHNFKSEIHLIVAGTYFSRLNYRSKNVKMNRTFSMIKDWIAFLSDDWKVSIFYVIGYVLDKKLLSIELPDGCILEGILLMNVYRNSGPESQCSQGDDMFIRKYYV